MRPPRYRSPVQGLDMKCPDYYRLADGRSFIQYSHELSTILWNGGIVGLPYHCAISALEHLFRLGRKEGEADSDWEAFIFWYSHVPDLIGKKNAFNAVCNERRKIGDYDQWLASRVSTLV